MPPWAFLALVGLCGLLIGGVGIPLARAIASRIMHGPVPRAGAGGDDPRVDDLTDAMRALQAQMDELQGRLDFTERVIAQQKARDALPGAR